MAHDLSVIIPVHDKWDLTRDCLRSLREHSRDLACEVIVLDNASTDATAGELAGYGESLFGDAFRRVRFTENRNFGPACNVGAAEAGAPLLFFLNNDTLLTPGWHGPLRRALEGDAALGAVGPLLLYGDDTVQHLGVTFTLFTVEHLYRGFPRDHALVRRPRKLQAITAAALLLERERFLALGGFVEEYRNGFEDVDFCLQLGRTGKKLACIPDSVVYHLESQSAGRGDHTQANAALLYRRCGALYRPDKHVLGLRDGFVPCVNDVFDISLAMSGEEQERLDREHAGCGLADLPGPVRQNPWWVSGRERLVALLEEAGEYASALALLAEIAHARMDAPSYALLAGRASTLGNAPVEREARKLLELFASRREDREYLRQLRRRVRQAGDSLLEKLYAEKLGELAL